MFGGRFGPAKRIEVAGGLLLFESQKECGPQWRIELPLAHPEPEAALTAARQLKLVASR